MKAKFPSMNKKKKQVLFSKGKSTLKLKESNPIKQFPIVGIGASAGGLEALEQFLSNVPENSGMAFVIVQHLDPNHKDLMPEILRRITKMKVLQVKDNVVIKPNCVYVIPPNKAMSILKGTLHLFEPIETRGLRLPIDFFFHSLADDLQEKSIGIILSGMGSDGANGIRAIKEKGGLVMVQDPLKAKFDSMPNSAINACHVDFIAPADRLPKKLIDYFRYLPSLSKISDFKNGDKSAIEKIIILLRIHNGNDFWFYKKPTLYRRIERRMGVHQIETITSYVRFLQNNPQELDILFKEFLIGVTSFFRDPEVWIHLRDKILPTLLHNQPTGHVFRAWVPACSTGEEAYSLAIVFKETIEKIAPSQKYSVQIFATDLHSEAIEKARSGRFSDNISYDVSSRRLQRFFLKEGKDYRVRPEIREMVVFAPHNIIMNPPFIRMDFISCRNFLIYIESELQKKLLKLFHYSLNVNGILLLGSAETIGVESEIFIPMTIKQRFYKRSGGNIKAELVDFPSSFSKIKTMKKTDFTSIVSVESFQTLAEELLLKQYSPAGVLVNANGDILYTSKRTGKYLEPPVGKINMNIFAMLRDGLQVKFPYLFQKAVREKNTQLLNKVQVGTNGGKQTIDITIQWLEKPKTIHGLVMIVFQDTLDATNSKTQNKTKQKSGQNSTVTDLEKELQDLRVNNQSIQEEMQASQEELKSANEELQSTNEELTTSKEEMQSMNEELQTVNGELHVKIDDFERVNSDMNNLLNSINIAVLFLDKNLHIRRFTSETKKVFKLKQSDIGRPFTDIVSDLVYNEIGENVSEVLQTLVFVEKAIITKDGRWFNVRIMPYRTSNDLIDGVVITFSDITHSKKLEEKLNKTIDVLRKHNLLKPENGK